MVPYEGLRDKGNNKFARWHILLAQPRVPLRPAAFSGEQKLNYFFNANGVVRKTALAAGPVRR